MTLESKKKLTTFVDAIYKIVVTALLTAILLKGSAFVEELKTLSFTDVETKVLTEKHVQESLTAMELHVLRDHVGNPDYHMPKRDKDSIYVLREEFKELISRNATTNYQTKEELKEIRYLIKLIQNDAELIKKNLNK
jgi:DNA primase large subunit